MHRLSGLLHPFLYDHFTFVTVKLFPANPAGGTRLTSLAVALARLGQGKSRIVTAPPYVS